MKPYLKDLLIIALILLCFLIGCHWTKDHNGDVNEMVDTVYVQGDWKGKRDSIFVYVNVPYPVPYAVYAAPTVDSTLCDSVRQYTTSLDDSNGLVVVNSTVQGQLINQDITLQSYVDSFFRVDTMKITINEFKPIFALGATMQFDSIGYIKPAIGFIYARKKASYSGSVNSNGRVTLGGYFNLIR